VDYQIHRPADEFCGIALQSRVKMYLCNSPAVGPHSLEQPVVVVVQQQRSLEQSDRRLASHAASIRLQLLVYGEQ